MSSATAIWAAARREVVEAVRAGRISRAEVARGLGVTQEAIGQWLRREGEAPRFVAVEVSEETSHGGALEVVLLGGRVIRVPAGFDSAELSRLVRALESC